MNLGEMKFMFSEYLDDPKHELVLETDIFNYLNMAGEYLNNEAIGAGFTVPTQLATVVFTTESLIKSIEESLPGINKLLHAFRTGDTSEIIDIKSEKEARVSIHPAIFLHDVNVIGYYRKANISIDVSYYPEIVLFQNADDNEIKMTYIKKPYHNLVVLRAALLKLEANRPVSDENAGLRRMYNEEFSSFMSNSRPFIQEEVSDVTNAYGQY